MTRPTTAIVREFAAELRPTADEVGRDLQIQGQLLAEEFCAGLADGHALTDELLAAIGLLGKQAGVLPWFLRAIQNRLQERFEGDAA